MYKNLINQVAEQKAVERKQLQKEQANQKRLENAKYNTSDLFVGYLSKVIAKNYGGRLYFKRLTQPNPRIFRHTALDTFQDIETEKFYPLIKDGVVPKEEKYCVNEISLENFEWACIQVLEAKGIEPNTKLTINHLKQILEEQQRLEEFVF